MEPNAELYLPGLEQTWENKLCLVASLMCKFKFYEGTSCYCSILHQCSYLIITTHFHWYCSSIIQWDRIDFISLSGMINPTKSPIKLSFYFISNTYRTLPVILSTPEFLPTVWNQVTIIFAIPGLKSILFPAD